LTFSRLTATVTVAPVVLMFAFDADDVDHSDFDVAVPRTD
jgi:hypothetical protein